MKIKPNQDIRDYMKDRDVSQIDLGKYLGTHNRNISSMLTKELPEKKKEELIRQIDACAEDKRSGPNEDIYEDATEEVIQEAHEDVTGGTRFKIGDRVKIPSRQLVIGKIVDIWHSIGKNAVMYAVECEGGHTGLFGEDQLEPAPLPVSYRFEAVVEGNVAVVAMHATQGNKEWVITRGHAHIIHDGDVGMAQAVSFAARRMFENLDRQGDKQIYFKKEDMK